MSLGVVVLTSPGREDNLDFCLKALEHQSFQDFELLLADDGSAGGEAVLRGSYRPAASYLWRPNDYCMSRSYNLAVASLQTDYLVFVSADILLHPQALAAYAFYQQQLPEAAVYGYFGNLREQFQASCLFPERQVNLADSRFQFQPAPSGSPPPNNKARLQFDAKLEDCPQAFAWGGHWAISRRLFEAQQGFNEAFQGWGLEDVDFANRLVAAGVKLYFSLEVWGEHQLHPLEVDESQYQRNQARLGNYVRPQQAPGLIYDAEHNPLYRLLANS